MMSTRRTEAGFTLIEVIVVIVIMTLIASVVLVRQPWHSAGVDTDATIRAVTSALRLARARAIAMDRNVPVVTGAAGLSVDGVDRWALPAGQVLSQSQVLFMPDGGSSGTTIMLAAGQRRVAISVKWLTGRVLSREVTER